VLDRPLVRPAYLHVPSTAVGTDGDLVEQFGHQIGRVHDPEQMIAINAVMSVEADGAHAAMIAALICARQNLKTFCMESIALTKFFVMKSSLIIWSAHEVPTAMNSFKTFEEYCLNYDDLRSQIKSIVHDTYNEKIITTDGRELRIKARTKGGSRGLAGPDVFLDEAYAVQPAHMDAIVPVMSAQPNGQLILGSSAGQLDSDVLREIRDQGRAGDDDVAYAEWCAPGSFAEPGCVDPRCDHTRGSVGCSLDRQDYLLMANPAKDRRIGRKYLRAERKVLTPEGFARERLGWWDEPLTSLPIPLDRFLRALDPMMELVGPVVFTVEVEVDRSHASITVAGRTADGLPGAHVIDCRKGVLWAVPRIKMLRAKHKARGVAAVLVNDSGPAGSLLAALAKENMEITLMSGADMAKAAGDLYSKTMDEAEPMWRFKDPIPEPKGDEQPDKYGRVVKALRGSAKRKLGDAWAFDRRNATALTSPLVGVSMGIFGVEMIPAPVTPLVGWGN
jgi:hypothetical protein